MTKLPGVVDADSWKQTAHHTAPVSAPTPIPPQLSKIHDLITALNQLPEAQLTEKSGAAVQTVEALRVEDGPDYAKLKILLARADVRKSLGPGTKGVLADLVSPRWDAFNLAGNLWLAALKSSNPDISVKARQRLPNFIQTAHVPVLINLLKVPGPNVLAFDVLQDVTGQKLDPNNPKAWSSWWNKSHANVDVVGHMVNQSRQQLQQTQIPPLEPNDFWYAPEEISQTDRPYASRSATEQNAIGRWSDAARTDTKRYLDQWETAQPLFEHIVHQPDPRVGTYLRSLISDPGMGAYVSVVLAWRGDMTALKTIQEFGGQRGPAVGRMLARGTLGDKSALQDLLKIIEAHKPPLSYGLMDDELRGYAAKLLALGVVSAEQAFELLVHERLGLVSATSTSDKKKALKKAQHWLKDNFDKLTLDPKHGYYVAPAPTK